MADDRDRGDDSDGVSPWLRDDWTADPAPLGQWETEPAGRDHTSDGSANTSRRTGLAALVAVVVLALIGAGVWMVANDDPGTSDDTTAAFDTLAVESTAASSMPASTPASSPPSSPAPEASPTPTSSPVPPIADGDEIEWIESTLEVPPLLAAMTGPTEVVVATSDRELHRIEFPSGRVRTLDMTMLESQPALAGASPQVVVGPTSLVVIRGADATVLRGNDTVTFVEVPGGAPMVQPRGDTGDLVVTGQTPADGVTEQRWILRADGSLVEPPASIQDTAFWETAFLPSGTLLLNRPGGIYTIADDGSASRLGTGWLRATGANHYLVEECDTTLQCRLVTVDANTGESVPWDFALDLQSSGGTGTRLSPDGGALLYFDYSRNSGVRRLVDLGTGESFEIGSIGQLVWEENWATDSSGVFVEDDGRLRFVDRSGLGTVDFDLDGRVVSVATRPPPGD